MLSEDIYDSWHGIQKEKFAEIKRQLPREVFAGLVLDIGCGHGYMENFFEGTFIGIDNNLAMIGKSLSIFPHVLGDGAVLPFLDNSFDTVVSIDTMHLIKSEDYLRVLKNGGFALFSIFFNDENYNEKRKMLLDKMKSLSTIKEFAIGGKEKEFVILAVKV